MSELSIVRYRGDTIPDEFTVNDPNGSPQNITGATFVMTLDKRKAPPDATSVVVTINGTVTSGSGGIVQFDWSALDADQEPGTYWFDIEMTDSLGVVQTLTVGKYTFIQDITK